MPEVPPLRVTVNAPVAASVGTVKAKVVADVAVTAPSVVPPPCLANVTDAVVPCAGWRFVPVTVIREPMVVDFGLKSVTAGAAGGLTVKPAF